MTMKKYGALVPMQTVAKDFGVSKKDVKVMVDTGVLQGVPVGEKVYITSQSIYSILGQNSPVDFGQQVNGYPSSEELASALTNEAVVEKTEEEGADMAFKGSVSTLKDGRFMVQIDKGKSEDGKRLRESKGFKSEKEAKEYLNLRLNELNGVKVPEPTLLPESIPKNNIEVVNIQKGNYTTLTFKDYAMDVLETGIGKATSRTMNGYRIGLSYIIDSLGKVPMTEITKKGIAATFKKLIHAYAQSTIDRSFNVLKIIMTQAYEEGDIPVNPMRKMECPKSRKPEDTTDYVYSDEEIKFLFKTSKEYSVELYSMMVLLECTGMRPAEMRGLQWSAFNPEKKTIFIKQAVTYEYEPVTDIKKQPKAKEIIATTKSKYGKRELPLSDLAVQVLLDWKKRRSKSRSQAIKDSPYIFCTRKGGFKTETSCQSMIQRYKSKYDLKDMKVTFYKFRHTYCTRLVLAGIPIPVIQNLLGDNTPDMVTKIYTHVTKEKAIIAVQPFYEDLNKKHKNLIN